MSAARIWTIPETVVDRAPNQLIEGPMTLSQPVFKPVTDADYTRLVSGQVCPHRAAVEWDSYAQMLGDRPIWRGKRLVYLGPDGQAPRAVLTLRQFHLRTMDFLWAEDNPVWIGAEPTVREEKELVDALGAYVRQKDPRQAFIRLSVLHHDDVEGLVPTCQDLCAHDATVFIDLSGDEAALRSRMKARGRRAVNKAGRVCEATVAEETDITEADFAAVGRVMEETAERDGFPAHTTSYYWNFFEHFRSRGLARLWVARIDGRPVNWAMFIIFGDFATYEIAASTPEAQRNYSPDLTLYTALLALQGDGVRLVDLVAVGTDFNPALRTLNQFKTKWNDEITPVSAPMELVLKPNRYRLMNKIVAVRDQVVARRSAADPQD
ncbi:lipid II:glycine glycyltransferase FemX [Actinomyces trachealis]|uniref:lipid II:glycine glycyltransferase FemX n=1 Tax=Actinomyces trachealis TaxID=2763540 RepID=UPI0018C6B042|nr:GNAT family N-acetyltransferase [Actinomyces trachealis]